MSILSTQARMGPTASCPAVPPATHEREDVLHILRMMVLVGVVFCTGCLSSTVQLNPRQASAIWAARTVSIHYDETNSHMLRDEWKAFVREILAIVKEAGCELIDEGEGDVKIIIRDAYVIPRGGYYSSPSGTGYRSYGVTVGGELQVKPKNAKVCKVWFEGEGGSAPPERALIQPLESVHRPQMDYSWLHEAISASLGKHLREVFRLASEQR